MMSAATATKQYRELLWDFQPSEIHTEAENEMYTKRLEQLTFKENATVAERKFAHLLTMLIEEFEERHYGFDQSRLSALDMLKHLMEENDLKQKDLLDVFSTKSIVSEVVSGKREMTLEQMKKLAKRFHVPVSVFVG